ncbi:MAG: hypothetical protein WD794_09450 [Mycobacteriales bacterium]
MTSLSYCAPCIADLALVREAATSVAGTAACMAHAVLLTHSSDDPGRRRQRLDALRDLAHSKAENADPAEQAKMELLVQEYGLAGAMDMGGPGRRAPQVASRQGAPSAPGEGRKSRRGRPRPDSRPAGEPGERQAGGRGQRRPGQGESAPVTAAPGPAGEDVPVGAVVPAAGGSDVSGSTPATPAPEQAAPAPAAPEQVTPAAPQPAPGQVAAPEPAAAPASAPDDSVSAPEN